MWKQSRAYVDKIFNEIILHAENDTALAEQELSLLSEEKHIQEQVLLDFIAPLAAFIEKNGSDLAG